MRVRVGSRTPTNAIDIRNGRRREGLSIVVGFVIGAHFADCTCGVWRKGATAATGDGRGVCRAVAGGKGALGLGNGGDGLGGGGGGFDVGIVWGMHDAWGGRRRVAIVGLLLRGFELGVLLREGVVGWVGELLLVLLRGWVLLHWGAMLQGGVCVVAALAAADTDEGD